MPYDAQRIGDHSTLHARFIRRSALILPVNVPKFIEGAYLRGADAIVLDLEDSVPAEERETARGEFPGALQAVTRGAVPVLVRVNHEFGELIRDLDACVSPELDEVVLPKTESADQVKILDALLRERELGLGLPEGKTGINLLIESALGLERVSSIARASARVVTVALGGEDLKRELNIITDSDSEELPWAHARIIMAAYAAKVAPIGFPGSIAEYGNLEALRYAVHRGSSMGYMGGYCIHPAQVEILNEGFSPTEDQEAWARKVTEAFSLSAADGRSSTSVEGEMVDKPVVERARSVLSQREAIEAFEASKPTPGAER